MFRKALVTVAPCLHKVPVNAFLAANHMQHGQGQRGVCAGAHGNPVRRIGSVCLKRGLDGVDSRVAGAGVGQCGGSAQRRPGIDRLFAPDQNDVGIAAVWNGPRAHGIVKRKGHLHGADAAVRVVGAAVRDEEAIQVFAVVAPGGREYGQGFRPEFFFLLFQRAGDAVKGFLPAYGGKFPLAAPACAPQRRGKPVR